MNIIDNILKLAKQKSLNDQEINRILGLSRSGILHWKNGRGEPNASHIITLSKYFNVSSDYLLGITDMPQKYESDFSFEEMKLVQAYRKKSEMREAVNRLLELPEINTDEHKEKNA